MTLGFDFTSAHEPLAARMRPQTLDEYAGQQHIVGAGKPLRLAIEKGHCHSMILWGPPGTGKTTLAEIIAKACDGHLERISAVTSGVKDIRAAIERAQQTHSRTILFVDEVHRFNKSQQDAFLPFIEDGTVTFIGATTENPSFELNNALLSRARVYLLKALQSDDLQDLLKRALHSPERGLGGQVSLTDDAEKLLLQLAGGDARRLLNTLELAADFAEEGATETGGIKQIGLAAIKDVAGGKVAQYDKGGDQFYDMISAFHKSVRGSSPDGALYWYARMLNAGGDPLYVARRLLAIASEDIGNADPRAMQLCVNAWDVFQRVGPAEGERAIAQAAVYCACAPKSNAVYTAFKQACRDAREQPDHPVPAHLRNAPTKLMSELGYGEGYRYAHDEAGAYAAGECYLPEAMQHTQYYQPSQRGLEKQISEKLAYLREQDNASPNKRYS